MFDQKKFCARLKELRVTHELTLVQLADGISVSDAAVSRWETGKRIPAADDIVALADFFGVSTDYLLCRTNKAE